jgi:L-lactate dehydrogenase (cytochrome)
MDIRRRYPGIADLERAAARRVPKFAWEFLIGGIGPETGLARNRAALDAITLLPRYLGGAVAPDLSVTLMGRRHDLPFGVAPMGLGGLIRPRAAEIMAAAARRANIPFGLSSFATVSPEEIARIAPEQAWFQHYPTNRPEIERDLIGRAQAAGYRTMIVTVDIPTTTKRDRDIRNGLSVPPRVDLRTLAQILPRPRWALETLRAGLPEFRMLAPYAPRGASLAELGAFLQEIMEGHVTPERLQAIRDAWPGKLVVKGVLDPADAETCRRIGADALVVSNHGGRQLDAAPAAPEVLAEVRAAAGGDMAILADGGMRSGLDVARMLAAGADFVLLGRAFMFGVAALGARGGDHVVATLAEELRATMGQIGCARIADLPRFRRR